MSADEVWPLAVAVVLRRGAQTLLIRRAEGLPAAGYWTPITGRPGPGEALEDAARREALEEVGLRVHVGAEIHRCQTVGARFELVWFDAALVEDSPLRLDPAEVAEARWCSVEEAARLTPMFEVTRAVYQGLCAR